MAEPLAREAPLLAVRDLSKAYGRVQAVAQVSLAVGAGEVFGLLGPNGAGKTTTIESIIGLTEPDSGTVTICGIDARARRRAARGRVGVTLQATGLQDKITPREALNLFATLYGANPDPDALLDRFDLAQKADVRVGALSGGQKQRLALALAFVNNPAVLVLDEPTAGLDPLSRRQFHRQIRALKAEGRAVMLCTHDMDEAEQLCDRIAVLNSGRIVAQGAPAELMARARALATVVVQTNVPLDPAWLAALPHIQNPVCADTTTRFTTAHLNQTLTALLTLLEDRQIMLSGLKAGQATLEDVIIGFIAQDTA